MESLAKIYEPQIRARKQSEKRIQDNIDVFSASVRPLISSEAELFEQSQIKMIAIVTLLIKRNEGERDRS